MCVTRRAAGGRPPPPTRLTRPPPRPVPAQADAINKYSHTDLPLAPHLLLEFHGSAAAVAEAAEAAGERSPACPGVLGSGCQPGARPAAWARGPFPGAAPTHATSLAHPADSAPPAPHPTSLAHLAHSGTPRAAPPQAPSRPTTAAAASSGRSARTSGGACGTRGTLRTTPRARCGQVGGWAGGVLRAGGWGAAGQGRDPCWRAGWLSAAQANRGPAALPCGWPGAPPGGVRRRAGPAAAACRPASHPALPRATLQAATGSSPTSA